MAPWSFQRALEVKGEHPNKLLLITILPIISATNRTENSCCVRRVHGGRHSAVRGSFSSHPPNPGAGPPDMHPDSDQHPLGARSFKFLHIHQPLWFLQQSLSLRHRRRHRRKACPHLSGAEPGFEPSVLPPEPWLGLEGGVSINRPAGRAFQVEGTASAEVEKWDRGAILGRKWDRIRRVGEDSGRISKHGVCFRWGFVQSTLVRSQGRCLVERSVVSTQNVAQGPAWPKSLLEIQDLRCAPDLLNLNMYLNKTPR